MERRGTNPGQRRSGFDAVPSGPPAAKPRKLIDAEKVSPCDAHGIKQLSALEHEAIDLDVAVRLPLRREKSILLLAALKATRAHRVTPKPAG